MSLNRFAINDEDHAEFGALIKRWSRGATPVPSTIEELEKQLIDNSIRASFPTGENELTELNVIWGLTKRLDIRLPPADHLDESEKHLSDPDNSYDLPKFYEDVFGASPDIPHEEKIPFHNARIGDYTVANCI